MKLYTYLYPWILIINYNSAYLTITHFKSFFSFFLYKNMLLWTLLEYTSLE